MTFILEKLHLGSVDDALATSALKNRGISHILTVDCKPLPIEKRSEFEYKYVNALDMDDTDILSRLQECIDFIQRGREEGGILIHCLEGQSRSATIVLAYMMQKLDMTLTEATSMLKKSRPGIKPNDGFHEQLELFENMGSVVDTASPIFKMYRLAILSQKIQTAQVYGNLPVESMAADPTQSTGVGVLYKCRKCRRPLFRESAVFPHTVGKGEVAFTWRAHKVEAGAQAEEQCEQQIFIEPVAWMQKEVLQLEGKLGCPKCAAKIGSFKWTGERCPCGTWVTPAFHIQSNKVDMIKPRVVPKVPGLAQISAAMPTPQVASNDFKNLDTGNLATAFFR